MYWSRHLILSTRKRETVSCLISSNLPNKETLTQGCPDKKVFSMRKPKIFWFQGDFLISEAERPRVFITNFDKRLYLEVKFVRNNVCENIIIKCILKINITGNCPEKQNIKFGKVNHFFHWCLLIPPESIRTPPVLTFNRLEVTLFCSKPLYLQPTKISS